MVSVMTKKKNRLFYNADLVLLRLDRGLEGLQTSIEDLRQEVQILRSQESFDSEENHGRERTE